MFVTSDILSDSNNQLSDSIFVMPDILSGAWKKIILSLVQEICSSYPPVVAGICDSSKSQAQVQHSFLILTLQKS